MKTLYNSINESLFGSRGQNGFIDTCRSLAEASQQNNQKWQKLCRVLDVDPEDWKYRNLIQFIMITLLEHVEEGSDEYNQTVVNQCKKDRWDIVEFADHNFKLLYVRLGGSLVTWNNQKRSGRIEPDDLTRFMNDDMLVTVLVKWRKL